MADGPIDKFIGEYRWLSNFHPSPLEAWFDDNKVIIPTVEHYYQGSKASNREDRERIFAAKVPGEAKKLGQRLILPRDWETRKLTVMRNGLEMKFGQHKDLREKLLATGDRELIEGNNWNDRFWGKVNGVGENFLGRLLMALRRDLRRD